MSERIPKTTSSSGHLYCEVYRARGKKDHKLKYDVRYARNAIQCKLSSVVYYNKEALLFEASFEAVELD